MDDCQGAQLKKLRNELEGIRVTKHKTFAQLNGLAETIFGRFREVFPMYEVNKNGSKLVHHPNVPECHPISLEKEHGNREYVPRRYAKFALEGLERLLDHIESTINENN
jgi:hypothetical protein